jgi:hypothetical protein
MIAASDQVLPTFPVLKLLYGGSRGVDALNGRRRASNGYGHLDRFGKEVISLIDVGGVPTALAAFIAAGSRLIR